ncbi:MAG: RDD family protein, partial [Myxococcota bacterium]
DRRPDPRHHSAPNGAPDAIADPETLAHLLRDVEQADPGLKTVKSGDAVGRSSEPRPLPKRASTAAKDKLPRMTYSPADVIDRAKTAMPGHRTSGEKEIHFAAAPLWRRMLATVVDGALVGGLMYLPISEGWLGPVVQNIRVWEPDDIGRALFNGDLTLVIVLTAVVIILLGAVPHGLAGRSLGKLITGLTLVNNWTGEKPSWVQVMLRQLVGIVTTMVGFATYLWFIVDRRSSALHDRLAGTSCVISSSRSIR